MFETRKTRLILPAVTSIHSLHLSKGADGRPLKTASGSKCRVQRLGSVLNKNSYETFNTKLKHPSISQIKKETEHPVHRMKCWKDDRF